jgi:anaerobic dimethyl sulfoxide reductase subunit B (iron-sulfur subunit)
MTEQYAFFFNASTCSGCKACQMACKDKHDLDLGLLWRRVYEIAGGSWEQKEGVWVPEVAVFNLSIACNHCQKPLCLEACPTGAIYKREDGIVLIETSKCTGCRYCEWACPYSAPQYDSKKGVMTKCHFCYDRIDRDQSPVCVTACPQRALDFGEIKALRKKYGTNDAVYPLAEPSLAEPALIIRKHRDTDLARRVKAALSNREEVNHADK